MAELSDRIGRFINLALERIAAPYNPEYHSLAYWRARILFSMLFSALVLGVFAFMAGIAVALEQNKWGLVLIDIGGYLFAVWLLISKRMRYEVRASISLLTCYAVGIAVIVSVGPLSGGPAWLFAFAVFTGILLGPKPAVFAILLNAISLSIVSYLIYSEAWQAGFPFFRSQQAMLAAGINFLVLNGIVAVSVAELVKGLIISCDIKSALAERLEKERHQLLSAKQELEIEIGERMQAQKDLSASEEKYRSFIENAPIAMYTLSTEGLFTYGNKKLTAITGYRKEDWAGKPFHTIVHAEDLGTVLKKIEARKSGAGSSEAFELRIHHASGEIMWVEIISESIYDQSEDKTKKLVGIQSFITDITRRKTAEQALKESEQKYRQLFETESDAIFLIEKGSGKIIEVNAAAIRLYGYDRNEFLEMSASGLSTTDDKSVFETSVLDGRNTLRYHRRKNGEVFPVEISASDMTWEGLSTRIAAVRDVSARVRDEAERLALEKELNQARKMESIGTLTGGIAHDFNNLLYPIIGFSEMLLEDLPRGSMAYQNAELILRSASRGSDLVKQILAFSRQSDNKALPVRFQQVLRDVLKLVRATIPADIEIRQSIQPDCGPTLADPSQLHQIVMNLVTNAYHAVELSRGVIRVSLQEIEITSNDSRSVSLTPGKYLLFSVSDNGQGIDPSILGRIYEPYFTTKEQGKGTGLGLSVVYGIVGKYKGDIKASSQLGVGTTFDVYLPVLEETLKDYPVAREEKLAYGNERILLVDDEEDVVRVQEKMLERLGYRVTAKVGSTEALKTFSDNPDGFDLVLTDMTMPNMTGDRLARELISLKPDIPIIICTGFSERISQEKAGSLGIRGFLMKPVILADLARIVRTVLDASKPAA